MYTYIKSILIVAVSVCLSGAAAAGGSAAAGVKPFFKTETGACIFSATARPRSHTLRIDLAHLGNGHACGLSMKETVDTFSAMLEAHAGSDNRVTFGSVMIGPLSHYAWIQKFLTETARVDPGWSAKSGRPVAEKTMTYVDGVLSYPAVISVLNTAAHRHGYRFTTASCEQIHISSAGLPTDAVCWIDMVRR